MARYIDADKMVSKDNASTTFPHDLAGCDDTDLVRWINEQPTVDVVPRAKIAEIFEEIEDYIDRKLALLIGVIEDGEVMLAFKALLVVQDYLVELKKKYTEGKT